MQSIPPFSNKRSNPLLIKDDVGKSKVSTYNLPNDDFIYGKPLARDKEGAKEVTLTWKYHQETQDKQASRDFTELNKMSLKNGLHKSHDFYKFRQSHDARLKVKKGSNLQAIELPEEDFAFGMKNRPSTPMRMIMGNNYGQEAESIILERYHQRASSQDSHINSSIIVKSNKASNLFHESNHKKINAVSDSSKKNAFKMEQFKNVSSRINTNLSQKKD